MKPTKLGKIKEKEKVYNAVSKFCIKGLKIIIVKIMNYQMLKKIKNPKTQAYKLKI